MSVRSQGSRTSQLSTGSQKKIAELKANESIEITEEKYQQQIDQKRDLIVEYEDRIRRLEGDLIKYKDLDSLDETERREYATLVNSINKCKFEIDCLQRNIGTLQQRKERDKINILKKLDLKYKKIAVIEEDEKGLSFQEDEFPEKDDQPKDKVHNWLDSSLEGKGIPPQEVEGQQQHNVPAPPPKPVILYPYQQGRQYPANYGNWTYHHGQPQQEIMWGNGPITYRDGHNSYQPQYPPMEMGPPPVGAANLESKVLQLMDNQLKIMSGEGRKSSSCGEVIIKSTVDKDLPFFNGNPAQFNNFKSAFIRSTAKYHFDEDENMVRIQKALKGEAKERVSHLMANPRNMEKLLKTLEDTYGRPEYVLDYLVEKAKLCDKVENNKPESLVKFGDAVEALTTNIASYNKKDYLHNKQLVKELIRKLSGPLRDKWYEYRANDDSIEENLEFFGDWLEIRVKAARLQIAPSMKSLDEDHEMRKPKRGPASVNVASAGETNKKTCVLCQRRGHTLEKCWEFNKKTVNDRWSIVKDAKLCFKCLENGHGLKTCKSQSTCGAKGCKKPHHSLLHPVSKGDSRKGSPQTSSDEHEDDSEDEPEKKRKSRKRSVSKEMKPFLQEGVNAVSMGASVVEGTDGALPIVPVTLRGPNGVVKTFAMLDNGASRSLIEEDLAAELGLNGKSINISFRGFGGHLTEEKQARSVNVNIKGKYKGARYFGIDKVVTVGKIGVAPYSLNLEEAKKKWPCLRRIKGKSLSKVVPRIIIGSSHRHLSIPREVLCSTLDGPVATRTLLGWVLEGDLENGSKSGGMYYISAVNEELDISLHNLIKDSFKVEDFGIKPSPSRHSVEDKRAQKIMEATTLMTEGRWETGLLWRDETVKLPESFDEALKRLSSTEKRMERDPSFKASYVKKIQEYLAKGYILKVSEDKMKREERSFYIPHFGVTNPNKPGKFRLVFDAAAKCHGSSLNDHLLTGPDLLRPLPSVLWNFRLHRYVICGDVEDMFHRIKIRNEDKPCQRFLWRNGDSSRQPETYEMQVLIFGATSSPASAIYVKDKNADGFKEEYPAAYRAIKEDFYMDDCLTGGDSEDDVAKLREEITHINLQGGFHIKKWISNSQKVMKTIPEELKLIGARNIGETTNSPHEAERVLGLWWDPLEDFFTFKTSFHKMDPEILEGRQPTKREVCRLVMSIYDPLGFIGHYRIKGMIILQHVWRHGSGWDDEIPDEVYELWKVWLSELQSITDVRIPRCYVWDLIDADRVELHTFTDASKEAYAAVSYIRIVIGDNICVALVSSKVKVAPLKSLTVPRLDLQAAVLGAKLANVISTELRTTIHRRYFWSDSRTVLSWIKSETARLKEFVGNRAGAIQELTNSSDWKWSTKENVADEATRLNSKTEFSPESRWFNGPDFLLKDEKDWPQDKNATYETEEEIISDSFGIGSSTDGCGLKEGDDSMAIPNVERFSSYTRLFHATAAVRIAATFWLKKAKYYAEQRKMKVLKISIKNNLQPPWSRVPGTLTLEPFSPVNPDHLQEAEKRILLYTQSNNLLYKGNEKKVDKSLRQLSPYFDEDGILRARGRIDKSGAPKLVRRPIILPSKHPVTNLIVEQEHRRNAHTGQETVFNNLRKKFWITHGRQAVRRCIARCQQCRIHRAKPVIPEMGILPSCRLASGNHPFTYTGIDYFGPMEVTVGRRHEKRWGVLLCCMVTRAIHIEIAHGLSADETMLALSRFVDARRRPHTIYSDNGSNFHGAVKELQRAVANESYKKLLQDVGLEQIRWSFIPPAAAHMAGAWARLIQSVKKALKNILHEQFPRDTVLLTALKAAENIVNSRPLTYLYSDIDDPEAITPNHFIKGGVDIGPSIPADIEGRMKYFKMKWKEAQNLASRFWERWTNEFLPKLLHRPKWTNQVDPLGIGDIVLIVDDQLPRNCWVKAVVTSTRPAKDGHVRDVEVTTRNFKTKKKTTLRRPVTKLCPLGLHIGKSAVMSPT